MLMSLKIVVTEKYLSDLTKYLEDHLETKYGIPFSEWDEYDKQGAIDEFTRKVFDDAEWHGYQRVADKYSSNSGILELLPEHFKIDMED